MSIINVNSSLNVSGNRGAKSERDGEVQNRADRAHSNSKQLEATGHPPETNAADGIIERFTKLSETRYDVVESAKDNLDNGYYDDRRTATDLAKALLDIS